MRRRFGAILVLIITCMTGQAVVARDSHAEFIDSLELGLHGSYRLDQLDWNVAADGINIRSELQWDDLKIWQLGAAGKLSVGNDTAPFNTYIRGSVDYGWITDGSTRDSDYLGNNRTQESYRSFNVTEDDNIFDTSIGLGFEKKFWQDRMTLGLLGGYSYHEQNLRLTDLVVIIENQVVLQPSNSVSGLNSTYETRWYGPFVGFDLELHPSEHIVLLGSFEYHWADYEAEANWNLKDSWAHPVSFRHDTEEADGIIATLKGSYLFKTGWQFDLSYTYRDFSARDGRHRVFPASGDPVDEKFNGVNWQSSEIAVGMTYRFK